MKKNNRKPETDAIKYFFVSAIYDLDKKSGEIRNFGIVQHIEPTRKELEAAIRHLLKDDSISNIVLLCFSEMSRDGYIRYWESESPSLSQETNFFHNLNNKYGS
jgi:hypothetical protein